MGGRMDPQELLFGRLLNWAEKWRGPFTHWDVEREFSWLRELAVALVKQAVEMGSIEAVGAGQWRRVRRNRIQNTQLRPRVPGTQ